MRTLRSSTISARAGIAPAPRVGWADRRASVHIRAHRAARPSTLGCRAGTVTKWLEAAASLPASRKDSRLTHRQDRGRKVRPGRRPSGPVVCEMQVSKQRGAILIRPDHYIALAQARTAPSQTEGELRAALHPSLQIVSHTPGPAIRLRDFHVTASQETATRQARLEGESRSHQRELVDGQGRAAALRFPFAKGAVVGGLRPSNAGAAMETSTP